MASGVFISEVSGQKSLAFWMLFSRTGMLPSPHLLQQLAMHHVSHRVSFFVDDAVMFLRPSCTDLQTIKLILDYFGHASGLRINLAKSSLSPIHCSETDLLLTSEILSCPVKDFPCTYLGLPLSLRKPTKTEFLPLIDKLNPRLEGILIKPGWVSHNGPSGVDCYSHLSHDCS